ncbi:hypothetical protein [Bacillus massilinigeriensis]|uniref:hypothetical protein n=1 Tax=Bacillus massilionigeriensis TaxID=1805475 RepID=UPI00096AFF78|nr:hypothetical protein [Bacillus massilionigeriensis]
MKPKAKAKWIIGVTGTAFSAFVLGQLNDTPTAANSEDSLKIEITDSMSEREKELAKLDWSNFAIQQSNPEGNFENDRTTRRT